MLNSTFNAFSGSDLVSIITPLYNSACFLQQTVASVRSQTYPHWEMIIVDDGSTDDGYQLACEFAKAEPRISVLRHATSLGPARARNLAIEQARGRYLAFLDSDDIWLPQKLSVQLEFMQDAKTPFCFTAYDLMAEDGHLLNRAIQVPNEVNYNSLLDHNVIGCLTAIYDSKALGKVYMPDILKRQDYGLWLKILKMIPSAQGLNQSLAIYRLRKNSVSSNKFVAAQYQWKIYRELEELSLLASLRHFMIYAFRGILKHYR